MKKLLPLPRYDYDPDFLQRGESAAMRLCLQSEVENNL